MSYSTILLTIYSISEKPFWFCLIKVIDISLIAQSFLFIKEHAVTKGILISEY